jgi:hypothetical protein
LVVWPLQLCDGGEEGGSELFLKALEVRFNGKLGIPAGFAGGREDSRVFTVTIRAVGE